MTLQSDATRSTQMTIRTVNGHKVTVDDGFLKLSREKQDATVDEIAKSLSLQLEKILVGVTVDPKAVAEARRYSYSDEEIVDQLSKKAPDQFKKAKEAGFNSKELLDYLGRENIQSAGATKVDAQSASVVEITKRKAQSVPTKAGRLGVVLHWAPLVIAAVLLGSAGLVLTQMQRGDNFIVSGALGVTAVMVWLVGKSLRYSLTGPAETPTSPRQA
jgi:hypothetical protein